MCYPKPAPRCSTHAKAALVKAVSEYKNNPDNEVSRAKVNEARKDYYGSPAGIRHLRNKAEAAGDQETAELYRKDADHYEAHRKDALAKYNRVKDLPAERREWDYDKDGYTDEPDHLGVVHTGAGEDYLAKNNLTDIHGWTTDDIDGDQDEPVWVDTPEGISSYDVRSVELYNVKKGMEEERRTVYRLDDGDGAYSTYGSYEDAAASLQDNVGTVVTEQEANDIKEEENTEYYDPAPVQSEYSEDEDGVMRDEYGYDEDGFDEAGFTEGDRGEEPRDRLGFNHKGFVAYPHSKLAQKRYAINETVSVNADGRDEDGFKIGSFNEEAANEEMMENGAVTSPLNHFHFFADDDEQEGERDGEDNPSHLEDRHTEDADLRYHHKDTGTLFSPKGKDYWGRTPQEADKVAVELEEDGLIPN